jgi:hypothetical protein
MKIKTPRFRQFGPYPHAKAKGRPPEIGTIGNVMSRDLE